MKCPKDAAKMEDLVVDGLPFGVCPHCDGVWMDWGDLKKASNNMITEYELIFRGESKRICPKCGKKMNKADLHSVVIEECACGLFFDRGEAEKVLGSVGSRLGIAKQAGGTIALTREELKKLAETGRLVVGETTLTLRD